MVDHMETHVRMAMEAVLRTILSKNVAGRVELSETDISTIERLIDKSSYITNLYKKSRGPARR